LLYFGFQFWVFMDMHTEQRSCRCLLVDLFRAPSCDNHVLNVQPQITSANPSVAKKCLNTVYIRGHQSALFDLEYTFAKQY
jgi:hypothetical protein